MTPTIEAERLTLTPLRVEDAEEMVPVLAGERLYAFTGGRPPSLAALRARYRSQVRGSGEPSTAWHNWIVRLVPDGTAVGTVQATVTTAADGRTDALIGWVIGERWHGRGFATEAARAMVGWLDGQGVGQLSATIHPDHVASAAVARRVGLEPTDERQVGETVWRRPDASNRTVEA